MKTASELVDSVEYTTGAPIANVDSAEWPSVCFACCITRNGRTVAEPYYMGVGNFRLDKRPVGGFPSPEFERIFNVYQNSAYAQIEDEQTAANYAAWVAQVRGIVPTAGEVLRYVAADALSGDTSFADFCADFGYDEDSRRAFGIWRACNDTRRELRKLFSEEEISALAADE